MTIAELAQAATFSGAAGLAVSTIVQSLSGTNGRKVLKALRGDSAVYERPVAYNFRKATCLPHIAKMLNPRAGKAKTVWT